MKNNKRRIVLSITVISLVLLILVGLTYAYFLTNIQANTNNKSISVDTRNLSLTYGDGNSSVITATKIGPGTTIGNKTFTVTNTGNVDNDYIVVIDNVSITYASTSGDQVQGAATTFESNDFVYTLTCTASSGTCDGETEETTLPLVNNSILINNKIAEGVTHTYTITVKYLETGVDQSNDMNKKLEARVNIGDINDSNMNPYKNNTNTLAYNIINNAVLKSNGTEIKAYPITEPARENNKYIGYKNDDPTSFNLTLSNATNYYIAYADDYQINSNGSISLIEPTILSSKYTTSDASTIVGKYVYWNTSNNITTNNLGVIYKVSTNISDVTSTIKYAIVNTRKSTENILTIKKDDYGMSYYYRGDVQDNYVNFAEMCWRIVRIEGDGSVKLVLEDRDQECSSSMDRNWNIPTTTGGNVFKGNFGYTQYNTGTITLSDGTTNQKSINVLDYINGQTSSSISMATAFKNFQEQTNNENLSLEDKIKDKYNNNELTLSNYLKSGDWCYGNIEYEKSGSSPNYTYTKISHDDVLLRKSHSSSLFYYSSYDRIFNQKSISLKCDGTIIDEFNNGSKMYVSALTSDEIAASGGFYNSKGIVHYNYNYYLVNNNTLSFMSLSPLSGSNSDSIFVVNNLGNISYVNGMTGTENFRPSVQLKPGITISSGNGTIDTPYEIS